MKEKNKKSNLGVPMILNELIDKIYVLKWMCKQDNYMEILVVCKYNQFVDQ